MVCSSATRSIARDKSTYSEMFSVSAAVARERRLERNFGENTTFSPPERVRRILRRTQFFIAENISLASTL